MSQGIEDFYRLPTGEQARLLFLEGTFIFSIRYYGYKINLYLYRDDYIEVFYNHKRDLIESIQPLDYGHTRMKFYADQININSIAS